MSTDLNDHAQTSLACARREFLRRCAGAGLVVSLPAAASSTIAVQPVSRTGPSRLALGLAAYSFRDYFGFMKGKTKTPAADGPAMDMPGFLRYCVTQGCDAAELTSYFMPPDADADYFRGLKRDAFLCGLAISGTAIGNDFTIGRGEGLDREIDDAKAWIEKAAWMGAPHIRFFCGTGDKIAQAPERLDEAIDALGRCADHAATYGIMLGVENHGNLTADQMLTIMQKVDSPWVGINLDTGNFFSDDPYGDLQRTIGYAVNVQVKVDMRDRSGKIYPADFDRIAGILRDGGYQGFVNLEYENAAPYQAVPRLLDRLRKSLRVG